MLFLVIFTPWEKVSCPTRPVQHAGRMGNLDPSPSYPWVKKPKFLLKPTYDVGEQNYLSQFYVYHVLDRTLHFPNMPKNPLHFLSCPTQTFWRHIEKEKRSINI